MERSRKQRWAQRAAIVLAAGVLSAVMGAAGVVAGSKFLKQSKYRKKEGIYSVYDKGPVVLANGVQKRVLTLSLPRGRYLLVAEVGVRPHGGLCFLEAEGDEDHSGALITGAGQSIDTVPLQLTHKFSSSGEATVTCSRGQVGPSLAELARLTAIRAPSLRSKVVD